MANRSLSDLLVVEVFVVVSVAVVLFSAETRILLPLFALPLVFIVPGYALTAMLFPRRTFGYAELLGYSLGLSLVIDILGGLVISVTPQGLSLSSWALWLGAATLCASIIAATRRPPDMQAWVPLRLDLSLAQGLMLGLSVAIAVSATAMVRDQATQPSNFTELWVLPAEAADPNTIQFGVRSLESARTAYRLEVQVGNDSVYNVPIDLQPGETWARSMVLNPPRAKVEVLLYRSDNPAQVYRQVVLQSNEN